MNQKLYKDRECVYSMKGDDKIRCSKCKSTLVYIRIRTKERICRSCGHSEIISSINTKEENK